MAIVADVAQFAQSTSPVVESLLQGGWDVPGMFRMIEKQGVRRRRRSGRRARSGPGSWVLFLS